MLQNGLQLLFTLDLQLGICYFLTSLKFLFCYPFWGESQSLNYLSHAYPLLYHHFLSLFPVFYTFLTQTGCKSLSHQEVSTEWNYASTRESFSKIWFVFLTSTEHCSGASMWSIFLASKPCFCVTINSCCAHTQTSRSSQANELLPKPQKGSGIETS